MCSFHVTSRTKWAATDRKDTKIMAISPMIPSLDLTERVPALVQLSPATVDFLLRDWRHVISLVPTRHRHRYRVTPLGHVGVLPAPDVRLIIHTKVPLQNVFLMLDPGTPLPALS